MDLLEYYYYAVNVLIFLCSLKRVIISCYELFYPMLSNYFRERRLKKVIHFYWEE